MRFTRVAGLCLLFSLLLATQTNAQNTGDYQTAGTDFNWTATSNWERWNGTTWVQNPSQGYPGENPGTGTVTIRDGAVVTINISPPYPIGGLVVGEGTSGILQFDNANRTLNIGSGGVMVNAGGTFQFGNAAQTLTVNGGSVRVNPGGIFQVTSAAPSTTHTPSTSCT